MVTALHCSACIEVPILSFGAYCILFKTPAQMSSVKWLMLNLHFWSSLSDLLLSFIGIPFILLPIPAGCGLGLIHAPAILIYCCVTLLTALAASVLAIYENRYYVLFGETTRWKSVRKPFMTLIYCLVPFAFLPPYLDLPEQESARSIVLAQLPCHPEFIYNDRKLFVLALTYTVPFSCVAFGTVVLATLISVFCLLTVWQIVKHSMHSLYSKKTWQMQKNFMIALSVQSALMLLVVLAPVLTILAIIATWHHDQTLNNFVFITLSLHGVGSTIVMIMVHRPYREFIISMLLFFNVKQEVSNRILHKLSPDSYFATPKFLSLALHCAGIAGLPIHIFGAWMIVFKTPPSMCSVKWPMLNLHFWSSLLDVAISLLTAPFVVFPVLAGFPMGYLKELGVPVVLQVHLVITIMGLMIFSLLAVFLNRYLVLASTQMTRRLRFIKFCVLTANNLLAVSFAIPFTISVPEQEKGLEKVIQLLPCLSEITKRFTVFVYAIDAHFPAVTLIVLLAFFAFEMGAIVLLALHNILTRTRKASISQKTMRLQRKFIMAMVVQTGIPVLVVASPLVYLAVIVPKGFYNQVFNNITFIIFSVHGQLSTFAMLFIHQPYRHALSVLIFPCHPRKSSTSSEVCALSVVKLQ
ncbi:unnamed protein product [Caenorhabditis sp. 36 PRJEB53466]|nr:unnamed protein product [Caenorhabditis sp. 36 PRJEB53466]